MRSNRLWAEFVNDFSASTSLYMRNLADLSGYQTNRLEKFLISLDASFWRGPLGHIQM